MMSQWVTMQRKSQNTIVKELMMSLMDKGMTDLCTIYDEVEKQTGIPRPTIRRIARDLRTDLNKKIAILEKQLEPLIVN